MKSFFKRLIYTLTLVLVFGYGFYTLIEQQIEMDDIAKKHKEAEELYENVEVEYERLSKEDINSDSYKIEMLREKGYGMENEIFFVEESYF